MIIPNDLQEEAYHPPAHEFKQVPSSPPSTPHPVVVPRPDELSRAADVLNAGSKVAVLIGQGARHAAAEVAGSPTTPARAWRKPCWARMCCPTTCRT